MAAEQKASPIALFMESSIESGAERGQYGNIFVKVARRHGFRPIYYGGVKNNTAVNVEADLLREFADAALFILYLGEPVDQSIEDNWGLTALPTAKDKRCLVYASKDFPLDRLPALPPVAEVKTVADAAAFEAALDEDLQPK